MIIIFDLDGTLFQTKPCDINAINYLFDELGLDRIDEQYITQNIGKKTDDFLRSLLPSNINPQDVRQRFRELEQCEVNESGILFPNVVEMLDELTLKGHSLFICSNGSMEYIELVLKRTGIKKYFSKIISSKLYNSKAEAVNNIMNSKECAVLIGDTLTDINAATKNNIPSIGVTYGYGKEEEILEATFRAQNTTEILDTITQIEVFYNITQSLIMKGKRILGINGVDTSGETMFTTNYSRYLEAMGYDNVIVHIDDFHNPVKIRTGGENQIITYYKNAFNYNQIIHEIMKPLQINGCVSKNVLCLNLDTDKYENDIQFEINERTIVLIEGVLLFREPMLEYLEGKIFLHIDFEKVMERARVRDVPKYGQEFLQKYTNKYIPVQKLYLSEHTPEEKSDIIINNQDYARPIIIKSVGMV